jgi:hypothetical protein
MDSAARLAIEKQLLERTEQAFRAFRNMREPDELVRLRLEVGGWQPRVGRRDKKR